MIDATFSLKIVGIQYKDRGKVLSETEIEKERERTCLSFYQHLSLTHLAHPPAYTLHHWLLSGSSLSGPPTSHPQPSSPPTFSFFTFAASVIFTLSLFFWSTGWHWWISLSCTGLGIKRSLQESFQSKNCTVMLLVWIFLCHCLELCTFLK